MQEEQWIFECGEEEMGCTIKQTLTLEQFDKHLDNYLKATRKYFTDEIFYKQFKMVYDGNSKDFLDTYVRFKKDSRHYKIKQLILKISFI